MIIALETASTDISLALADSQGALLAVQGWSSDRRQGHETLPRLLGLLAGRRLTLRDATAIAVGTGPGSFTGLRVGMSLAKGLAFALDVPVVGVPSLPAWLEAEPEAVAALARAGAREGYLLIRGEDRPRIADRDALPERAAHVPIVAPVELATAFHLADARPPTAAAAAVAAAGWRRLQEEPAGDDLAGLEPAYLRAPRGLGQVHHVEMS